MVCRDGNSLSVYSFCSISCRRTSAALIRVYRRLVLKLGSVWDSTKPLMSSSRFGKCSSARFRPRAEQASIQIISLSSSCTPLRMVSRFQPNSRSALRCPPLPIALTARAINSRRVLPFNSLAVSIKSALTSCVSSIFPSLISCSMCGTSLYGRIYFLQPPKAPKIE